MPPVAIIFLTYARTNYAVRTILSVKANLNYVGEFIWIVGDDGSPQEHTTAVGNAIGETIGDWNFNRIGYGAKANWAWTQACEITPITFWLEDDWELKRPFDITPYVNLLMVNDNVGMVRLGHLPIELELNSVGHDGHMYLNVQKGTPYAFSGNPHLKHDRFWRYGPYPEGKNPGETEISYDYQVRTKEGWAIWWPLLIGDRPPFAHIGEVQSYEAQPPLP